MNRPASASAGLTGAAPHSEIIEKLRSILLPGLEVVERGMPGDGSEYHWLVTDNGGNGREVLSWLLPLRPEFGAAYLEKWIGGARDGRWRRLAEAYRRGHFTGESGVFLLRSPPGGASRWREWGWRSSIPPALVAYVGAPGPWQKIVAGLIHRETTIAGLVVKFPISESAGGYLADEAAVLRRLAVEKPGLAPTVVRFDEQRAILAEEALSGESAGRLLEPLHVRFLAGFALAGETTSLAARAASLRRRAQEAPAASEVARIAGRVADLVDDDRPLPMVWVHGDLHSGNMVLRRTGQIQAFDWAFAIRDGLPFEDIARALGAGNPSRDEGIFGRPPDQEALAAYAGLLGVDAELYPRVAACCAAGTMLRRHRVGRRDEAERIGHSLEGALSQIG